MRRTNSILPFLLICVLLAGASACGGSNGLPLSPARMSADDDDSAPPDDDDSAPPDDDDNDNDDSSPTDDDDDDNDNDDSSPTDDDDNDDDNDDNDTASQTVWTDTATGLMWQNGSQVGSNALGWADAKTYCANLNWGGYSGWRLPDIDELRSLIRGCAPTIAGGACGAADDCLADSCWNITCGGCSNLDGPGPEGAYWLSQLIGNVAWYWSSSAVSGSGDAWDVNFGAGEVKHDPATFNDFARCVRNVDDDDDDDNDDNNDDDSAESVWVDGTSGLTWQNGNAVGSTMFTWDQAEAYCANLTWAGVDGWRLPDIDALRTLIRGCAATGAEGSCGLKDDCLTDGCWTLDCYGCDLFAGPGPGGVYWPADLSGNDAGWYWSSSASADPGWSYGVYFDYGRIMDYYTSTVGGVRCVQTTDDDDDDDNDDNDNDDTSGQTVWTDSTTGLMWQNGNGVGQSGYTWADAQTYCTGLTWHGLTGWRLPDIDTLRSLLRGCAATDAGGSCGGTDDCLDASCWNVACEGCASLAGPGSSGAYWDPSITGNADWYWSSSAASGDSTAWDVHFSDGGINDEPKFFTDSARCVRNPDDDDDNDDNDNDDNDTAETV